MYKKTKKQTKQTKKRKKKPTLHSFIITQPSGNLIFLGYKSSYFPHHYTINVYNQKYVHCILKCTINFSKYSYFAVEN